jgi:3D-(3,5/4)-trihydroxycyclohexane-1,2-dione acylhydrolase (decyclizing)
VTVRLTAAQAAIRYLASQRVEIDGGVQPYFAGVWAIFGHGNVAGLGAALAEARDALPTYRAHNEQSMAHAAIAFAKQSRRRRAMVCTTSIGPGATNLVTAAALAHVNRLPVLFLPGDVFANRRPDPVLQQVEDFADGTVSANDAFRPVSRYFDRITRPEQVLDCLPRAMGVLLDPASCGPVTLAFCQDVQAEAFDFPQSFFEPVVRRIARPHPDPAQVEELASLLTSARSPLFIVGGGVAYSDAAGELADLARDKGIPFAETQAGKGAIAWDHPCNLGALGVTGTSAANAAAAAADVVVGWGTRLQDFTTGSRALFARAGRRLAQVNVASFDALKHGALPVVGDARATVRALAPRLASWSSPNRSAFDAERRRWDDAWDAATRKATTTPATDAQVLGAVWRKASAEAVVVCAAGGLPGELHKLWRTRTAGGYHVEYGYSCMGYEIAGGLGVKMAQPARDVYVLVGDGSYLMMNSEIATSVMLGMKLVIVVLDNHGYGCINRLQAATGGAPFNNLFASSRHARLPAIDFAAHAASMGAVAERAANIGELEAALERAAASDRTHVVEIETDPRESTAAGGARWDVAVSEVGDDAIRQARAIYEQKSRERNGKE